MPTRRLLSTAAFLCIGIAADVDVARAQLDEGIECFRLEVDDVGAVSMLNYVQGDTLILTDEPLLGSPGTTNGSRAYFGTAEWRAHEPLEPFSWYWRRTSPDSVRIGFVLPLWGVTWRARRIGEGLEGSVTYTSDEVDAPELTSTFRGERIDCGMAPRADGSVSGSAAAAHRIRALPLDSFPDVPSFARAAFAGHGCDVAQSYDSEERHNVASGAFAAAGQTDWAILCARGDSTGVIVAWGGPVRCESSIGWWGNRWFLERIGTDELGFMRVIELADAAYLLERDRRHYGFEPPQRDHDGINDVFAATESAILFCERGRWHRLKGFGAMLGRSERSSE